MGKVTLSPEALAKKRAYDKKYQQKHFKGKNITFNTSDPDDMALLEWIRMQKNGNEYIKMLIRKDMKREEESQYAILPPLRTNRPCQIPIRTGRFRYLTGQHAPGKGDSGFVMYHHPGHFLIYEKASGQCIADATYGMLKTDWKEQPDDEIVAVIFEIRECPDKDRDELPAWWDYLLRMVRGEE